MVLEKISHSFFYSCGVSLLEGHFFNTEKFSSVLGFFQNEFNYNYGHPDGIRANCGTIFFPLFLSHHVLTGTYWFESYHDIMYDVSMFNSSDYSWSVIAKMVGKNNRTNENCSKQLQQNKN